MKRSFRYVHCALALQLALSGCSDEPAQRELSGSSARSQAAPSEQAAQQTPDHLVLAFGDSLYAGYGLDPGRSFPDVLEDELEKRGLAARIVNAGVSGDTTAGGRQRLAFTLDGLERKPDLVILGLGANDLLRGVDPGETRANLEAMLVELDSRGIPVLLTGMLAPRNMGRSYVTQFESIYPDLAAKHGARLDPFLLEGVIGQPALLLDDGLHPNERGAALIARRLAPTVAAGLE